MGRYTIYKDGRLFDSSNNKRTAISLVKNGRMLYGGLWWIRLNDTTIYQNPEIGDK